MVYNSPSPEPALPPWDGRVPEAVTDMWQRGYSVIPQRQDKRPIYPYKQWQEERPPWELVEEWAASNPGCLWAVVVPKGEVRLDFDFKYGAESTLRDVGLEPAIWTLHGGGHIPVRVPFRVKTAGQGECPDFPGMEILAHPHLATFYGSAEGKRYEEGMGFLLLLTDLPESLQAEIQRFAWTAQEGRPIELPEGFADFAAGDDLLKEALEKVGDGNRNVVGFELACQARDERMSQDEVMSLVVDQYQPAVTGLGEKPYTIGEAMESVMSAFSQPPREPRRLSLAHFPMTDIGNGERLVLRHGLDLRYCHPWKSWLVWDGKRWKKDDTAEVFRRAKEVTRQMRVMSADITDEELAKKLFAHSLRTETAARQRAMLEKASSESDIVVLPESFNRNRWLLNVENGTLDLRTGELRNHSRDDMLLKVMDVPYNARAKCPRWHAFLERILPDPETRAFIKRAVGYSLTGEVSEEVIFLMYGSGQNGKSKFIETLRSLLGPYAQAAPSALLTTQKRSADAASPDVARLFGARFVSAVETGEGRWLAETLLKLLTGGDRVTARFLYSDPFEFDPTHKFWLASNHLPAVRGTDEAIWRRILRIPFEVFIPPEERDVNLLEKLVAERRGVLRWAVEGCLEWQQVGLQPSQEVVEGTERYRAEQDVFVAFLEDRCAVQSDVWVATGDLYRNYVAWARGNGYQPMSSIALGHKLSERPEGFASAKRNGVRGWKGLSVATPESGGFTLVPGGGGESDSK